MRKYKVIFCDLDGTLIDTISGGTFPKGIWDMRLDLTVLDALKEAKPEIIVIVSNQGGIDAGFVNETAFQHKLEFVKAAIKDYTGINCLGLYCVSNLKGHPWRKPNTGMLSTVFKSLSGVTKEECCMIGDASGLPGQFSDSDKRTAENFGIDYYDVCEFVATP